jgi:lysophospholipase L1-like esterase
VRRRSDTDAAVFLALLQRFHRLTWLAVVLAVGFGAGAVLRLDGVKPAQAHPSPRGLTAPVPERPAVVRVPTHSGHWVTAWAAAPQAAVPANLSAHGFADQTLRQVVFSSAGGSFARIRLTNTFGTRPLMVGRASVAIQGAGARLSAGTLRPVTFSGRPSVVVRPGAEVLSDPVSLRIAPFAHVVISVYLPATTGPATGHGQARQVNYVSSGDRALAPGAQDFGRQTQSWYVLAGLDVLAPLRFAGTVVAFGDSITDGVGSPVNANQRWPNDLARRLVARGGNTLAVVDAGIGGNRVLNSSACCGVAGVARFRRDALDQARVRDVILLEGINDIDFSQSHDPNNLPHTNVSALQIVEGYTRIIAMAHAAGLRIFGATLTPFAGARYWTPAGEAKRQAVNRWIETSGAFDGVIDFAAAVADPAYPLRLNPAYDSGDHLHPNAAGYRAMANAVSLAMLLRATG